MSEIFTDWDTTPKLEKIQILDKVSNDLHIAESMFGISEEKHKNYEFITLLFKQYRIEIQLLKDQLIERKDLSQEKLLAIHRDLKTLKNNISEEEMYKLSHKDLKKYWHSQIEKLQYKYVLDLYHSHPLSK